jgi:serine/threonine protein kinase/WD40 repeat protein
MSEPNPSLEEVLFEVALTKPSAAERAAFLDSVCQGSPALRARLDVLLEGHFQAQDFLPTGPPKAEPQPVPPAATEEAASTCIGRYKPLEKLGEGGFGEVWMAEQKEPVNRRVALKIIKLGMDTKQVISRFEIERQALALMDHPNIAKVLDGGATETGRPYFVMELVRGVRITEYCDANQVPTQERLKLFIQVCRAIQHAHQKGIIHRDIKPSNILVTLQDGLPVPKVIDFGIAKATQQKLTDKTVFTQFRQFIGTPAYVSPEQAGINSLDVDTRSDIYSLGVLLYELLTGKTPFDTQQLLATGLDEMRRTIKEVEPLRPSTRLSTMAREELTTTAQRRGAESRKLISLVRGDLDWIAMKCLEKDRKRRYETANGLARDIERHLNHEPIVARPPSRLYEFQKTVRRHWVGFTAVVAVLTALTIGGVVSTSEAIRARRSEAKEANQKAKAQQYLYNSLVGEARATRLARQVGYRDRAFALFKRASALDVPEGNLADLRREAIACMGDFVGLTPMTFTNFHTNIDLVRMDGSGNLAAIRYSDGGIELFQLPSGKALARFTATNGVFGEFCFNPKGDQLFALQLISVPCVRVWSCEANGGWQETANRACPEIVAGLLSSEKGVYVPILTPSNKGSDWYRTVDWSWSGLEGGGIFVYLHNHDPNDTESIEVKVRFLDASTGTVLPEFQVTNTVASRGAMRFALSANGSVLAVATLQNSLASAHVKLYNCKNGDLIRELPAAMSCLGLNPDGTCIACISYTNSIVVLSAPSLERIGHFVEYQVFPAVFSRNTFALQHGPQNRIQLWDSVKQEDVAMLDEPEFGVPVAFTSDGNSLLTKGAHHLRLYRRNAPERLDLAVGTGAVSRMAFSPDGTRLAMAFGPDRIRQHLTSQGTNALIRVCDSTTGAKKWESNYSGRCLNYSPNGQWLVTGGPPADPVCIRDPQTGEKLLVLNKNGTGPTYSAEFSPDGRYLVTAAGPGGIKLWTVQRHESKEEKGFLEAKQVKSWERGVGAVFAPDSQSLAFSALSSNSSMYGQNLTVYLWDFGRLLEPRSISDGFIPLNEVKSFTPDSRHLLVMDQDGSIVTLDVQTANRISSFQTENPQPRGGLALLSPDGAKLSVTAESRTAVEIRDPKTGKLLCSFPQETGIVSSIAWSPDSRRLAVGRDNGNVAIWNLHVVETILSELGLQP